MTDEGPKETAKLLGHEADADDSEPTESTYGGAKPKVRPTTEDTRKRRRLLRKAHSIPQSSSQDGRPRSVGSRSADETTEGCTSLPQGTREEDKNTTRQKKMTHKKSDPTPLSTDSQDDGRTCPEFFGVRSYLHTFYESVSVGNPGFYDDFGDPDYRYLIVPKKKRRMDLFWKVSFWLGIHLLILGLILILIGYLVPKHNVIVGMEAEMEIVDKSAIFFNTNLDMCKIVGLVVFCVGGTILVAVLLFPSLMNQHCEEDTITPEGFKVATCPEDPPQSPTEKKIPATEELSSVQPKRETEETNVVMTNSGLCSVP